MNRLWKFFLVMAVIVLSSVSAHALFGAGVYGGIEFSTVEPTESVIDFNVSGLESDLSIVYNNSDTLHMGSMELGLINPIENPFMIGGHVFVEIPAIPITIMVSGGAAFAKYSIYYGIVPTENPVPEKREIEIHDLPYVKGNVLATVKYTIFDSPLIPVKPYLAGGAGYEFVGPVLSDPSVYDGQDLTGLIETLYNTAEPNGPRGDERDEPNDLDYAIIEEFADVLLDNAQNNSRIFYNAGVGLKIKFPLVPVAIMLDYRANFAGDQDFLPSMSHTIFGSLSFNI